MDYIVYAVPFSKARASHKVALLLQEAALIYTSISVLAVACAVYGDFLPLLRLPSSGGGGGKDFLDDSFGGHDVRLR